MPVEKVRRGKGAVVAGKYWMADGAVLILVSSLASVSSENPVDGSDEGLQAMNSKNSNAGSNCVVDAALAYLVMLRLPYKVSSGIKQI